MLAPHAILSNHEKLPPFFLRFLRRRFRRNPTMADLPTPSGGDPSADPPPDGAPAKSGEDNEGVKPVKSGLNPYAASYVPLSQQATSTDSAAGKMLSETGQSTDEKCHPKQISAKSEVAEQTEHIEPEANLDTPQIADDEEQSGDDSYGSDWEYDYYLSALVEHDGEMQSEDPSDNIDRDLAFLSFMYPNESLDDLVDVYISNGCDVGSAIDTMDVLLEFLFWFCITCKENILYGDVFHVRRFSKSWFGYVRPEVYLLILLLLFRKY